MRNFSATVYLAAIVQAYNRTGKRKELTTKLLHAHFVGAALSEGVVPVDDITTDAEIAARVRDP